MTKDLGTIVAAIVGWDDGVSVEFLVRISLVLLGG